MKVQRQLAGSPACIAAAMVLLGAVVLRSAPMESAQETKPPISTMTGVFTAAQAGRGEETYMTICVGCHPAGTYTGQTFNTTWGNRPLSDLFSIIKNTMPKVDPGMLTPQETAQVIAYILKSNGVPPGKAELPPELDTLKTMRIETPTMAAKGERETQGIR
jgi:mono/diheme cytochrome c family protein